MDKKFQVFVSSTFLDLKDERQAAIRAILNLGHVPSSMELFPASSQDQLTYIKKAIDLCDYYVLILGGRYGSLSEDGLSYTEKEYDYAIEKKMPVIALVHADTSELKAKFVEQEEQQIEKLNRFRNRVRQGRVCREWLTISELEAALLVSLTAEVNENPQVGWRRDTDQLSNEALKTINELQSRSAHWYKQYAEQNTKVKAYEDIKSAEIQIRYNLNNVPDLITLRAEAIIREFAAQLRRGLDEDGIRQGLEAIIRHQSGQSDYIEISQNAIDNTWLFFEVFGIVKDLNADQLIIAEESRYLLKAAFAPLAKVIAEYDDDIPF